MPPGAARRLAVAPAAFDSRGRIEEYLERLNRGSPLAQREILRWGGGRDGTSDSLRLAAVPLAGSDDAFIGEAEISFGLDVRAQRPAASESPYSVGVVLAGAMRVTLADGEHLAGPGQGVIIDPAAVERTQVAPGSHFVEFSIAKPSLRRLGAELAPGEGAAAPQFTPLLQGSLAQRLLYMATQAGEMLHSGGSAHAAQLMFQRWTEMIALTVLHEQPALRTAAPQALAAGVASARVQRALDFIDANAQRNIELADVAQAAALSASSLLRQFKAQLGLSPGAFLRQVRLDRARAELRRGQGGSIREVALRWGFLNASKFSQAYLQRFGELPRETAQRR
jgi:AraC-like DNA-binding protein